VRDELLAGLASALKELAPDNLPDLLTGDSYHNRLQLWLNGGKDGFQVRELSWP